MTKFNRVALKTLSVILAILGLMVMHDPSIIGIQNMVPDNMNVFINDNIIVIYELHSNSVVDDNGIVTYYTYTFSDYAYNVEYSSGTYIPKNSICFEPETVTISGDIVTINNPVGSTKEMLIYTSPINKMTIGNNVFIKENIEILKRNPTGTIAGLVIMVIALFVMILGSK